MNTLFSALYIVVVFVAIGVVCALWTSLIVWLLIKVVSASVAVAAAGWAVGVSAFCAGLMASGGGEEE